MTNKKKGFTLIELIAVIAILAILGAVLVPKIMGYQNKAKRSNCQTSAKTILHAIQACNADKVSGDSNLVLNGDLVPDAVSKVNGDGGAADSVIKRSGDTYTSLSTLTVAKLIGVANGKFNLSSTGTVTVDTTNEGSLTD